MESYVKILGLTSLLLFCLGCDKEFEIRNVSPPAGGIGGGEPVEILGSGFDTNMGTAVYFGNAKASNVVVKKDRLIVTTPSASEEKVVDVRIALDDGKEFLLKKAFRYISKGAMDIRDLGERKSMREKQ